MTENDIFLIIMLLLYGVVLCILGKALWDGMKSRKEAERDKLLRQQIEAERAEMGHRTLASIRNLLEGGACAFLFALSQTEIEWLYRYTKSMHIDK